MPPPPAPAVPALVVEEQLGDLKLYWVPERTGINARQQKQVRLLDRQDIPVELLYVAELSEYQPTVLQPAQRVLRTRNDSGHHLGLALPLGTVSTFTSEGDTPLLLAEGPLRDIAVGEDFEIGAGEAPDVQVRSVDEHLTLADARQIPQLPGCASARTGWRAASRSRMSAGRRSPSRRA